MNMKIFFPYNYLKIKKMKELIKTVFNKTVASYERFLGRYYPAHGSNGFTERNLTFNFSHNYLIKNDNAFVWQEVPLGDREHFDTLIIDDEHKSILCIEAKRLGTEAKQISIEADLKRIRLCAEEIREKIDKNYAVYALLLVDIWIPRENEENGVKGKKKRNMLDAFKKMGNVETYISSSIQDKKPLSKKETYQIALKVIKY
jgi:hypothetical protein